MRLVGLSYATILVLSGLQCLDSARRGKRAYWFAILDMMAASSFAMLVIAYVTPSFATMIGRAAPAIFMFGVVWTVVSAPHEWKGFKAVPMPAGMMGRVVTVTTLSTVALLVVPAIIIGALTAFASLR